MIRYAKVDDATIIQSLVNNFAKNGEMLSLSLNDVYEKLYEFILWIENNEAVGVCALHPTWADIAEIRSLAVRPDFSRKKIGTKLVEFMLERAKNMGFEKVFALTYRQDFFLNIGFKVTDIENLPKKIWTDCLKCVKYPDCDETAVIIDLCKE